MPDRRELHITVVSGFGGGDHALDVTHETSLVKAALLYADRVTLASPRVSMLAAIAPILVMGEDERAAAMLQLVGGMPGQADTVAAIRALERKRHKTVDEHYKLKGLKQALREGGGELAATVDEMLTSAGVPELAVAMNAGVLDLDPLGFEEGGGGSKETVARLVTLLGEVTSASSTTYPLLDEDTAGLLTAMVREGHAPMPDPAHLAQPAIATRWIGDMAAYPAADMQAVLELRQSLHDPLVRYRQAVIQVTDAFRQGPTDDVFAREAADAYRKNVTPELLHLEELAKEKTIRSLLTHTAVSDTPAKLVGAAMGLVGADAADMPKLLGGAIGVGVQATAAAVSRHRELSAQQRQSAYFYLFELERRQRRK